MVKLLADFGLFIFLDSSTSEHGRITIMNWTYPWFPLGPAWALHGGDDIQRGTGM